MFKHFILTAVLTFFIYSQASAQEICNNCLDDDGDGLIDCEDTDCVSNADCEAFYQTTCPTSSKTVYWGMAEVWRGARPNGGTTMINDIASQDIVVGDMDGDCMPEVLSTTIGLAKMKPPPPIGGGQIGISFINIYDGVTGVRKDTIRFDQIIYGMCNSFAIGDIDNDGLGEVVFSTEKGNLLCYENTLNVQKWVNTGGLLNGAHKTGPVGLADFDGDGKAEIYVRNLIFDALTGNLIAKGTGSQGAMLKAFNTNGDSLFEWVTVAADVLPDSYCADCAGLELICGNQVYAVNIAAQTMTIASTVNDANLRDGQTSVADINNDGQLDVAVTTGDTIYFWDPRTQNLLRPVHTVNSSQERTSVLTLLNVDNDADLECAYVVKENIVMLDNNNNTLWTKSYTEGFILPLVAFDFNNDGKQELIRKDWFNIFIIDGATGSYKTISSPCHSSGGRVAVADVDVDGHADLVTICAPTTLHAIATNGSTTLFRSAVNNWSATRTVMNQANYFSTHINEDLSIPAPQINHAENYLPFGYNGFMSQPVTPDEPDVSMNIDCVICDDDSITIALNYCMNEYYQCDSTALTLYWDDPLKGGQVILSANVAQPVDLLACEKKYFKVKRNMDANTIYAFINDDGTSPISAPVTAYNECTLFNNVDSFNLKALVPLQDTTLCSNKPPFQLIGYPPGGTFSGKGVSNNIFYPANAGEGEHIVYYENTLPGVCKDFMRDSTTVTVENCETTIFIPTAFSPGSDNINDVFKVYGNLIASIEIKIFNRWGELVFSSTDVNTGWDGTYQGQKVAVGVYVCKVKWLDGEGNHKEQVGHITLLR